MTAMERIKEIENSLSSFDKGKLFVDPGFLLKAFEVMRELYIEEIDEDAIGMKSKSSSAEVADKRFEERMNPKTGPTDDDYKNNRW